MKSEDAALQRWIGAVDRLASDARPDPEQLRAVAVELGLPADVVERAEERAVDLHHEALVLEGQGRYDEAVECLQRAVELVPWSTPMREALNRLRSRRRRTVPWFVLGGGALVVAAIAMWVARPTTVPVEGDTPAPSPVVRTAPKPLPPGPREKSLPLVLEGELPEGAVLTTDAVYKAYPSQGTWNVSTGVELVAGPVAIDHARFEVRLLDEQGVIASEPLELVGDSDPALYEGERAVGDVLMLSSVPRIPTSFVLAVERVATVPGEAITGSPQPVEGLPDGVQLVAHQRQAHCHPSFGARVACEGIFVIENTGSVAVDLLKLRAHLPDGHHDDTWAVATHEPFLAPGDRQPILFIEIYAGTVTEGPWRIEALKVSVP